MIIISLFESHPQKNFLHKISRYNTVATPLTLVSKYANDFVGLPCGSAQPPTSTEGINRLSNSLIIKHCKVNA